MTPRFAVTAAALLLVPAVALCFVPLFDLLAFEAAFAMGLPVTIVAGLVGLRAARGTQPAPGIASRAAGRAFLWALVPVVPLTLNMFRVKNCNYLEGLSLYLILPGIGALVAATWGVVAEWVWPRRAGWLFTLVFVTSLLLAGLRFYFDPPVDAYNPFLGYYPGSIYDEVIALDARLLWSRAEDLAWAVAALVVTAAFRRPYGIDPKRRYAWAVLTLIGVIVVRLGATANDVHRDANHIRVSLGGFTEAPGVQVFHPRAWDVDTVGDLVAEFRFDLEELHTFFGVETSRPVEVYLYPDEATKKRLMGAGATRIAKPWQWAIHLHAPAVGQPVIRHELAHVVAAELADPPLHVSLHRGLIPHPGLIEGVAVAATWDGERLDPHQWSAAMRRIGVAPPIDELLRPQGFLASNSRVAYTLCGSFVRHVHDVAGPEVVARAYRAGRFDVEGAPPFDELTAGWAKHVDGQPLGEAALAMAQVRFDRPAIFKRACAHEIAALWARREGQEARGDLAGALTSVETILGHVPRDPEAALTRVELLVRTGATEAAGALARALTERSDVGLARRARAREWLADLDALGGRKAEAAEAYESALRLAFDRNQERRLAVKRAALDAGEAGHAALVLLVTPPTDADGALKRLREASPTWPVGLYLAGRRQAQKRAPEAVETLRAALSAGLPHAALTLEAERLVAEALFTQRRYDEAAGAFSTLAARSDLGLERGETSALATWGRRARWFARHRVGH